MAFAKTLQQRETLNILGADPPYDITLPSGAESDEFNPVGVRNAGQNPVTVNFISTGPDMFWNAETGTATMNRSVSIQPDQDALWVFWPETGRGWVPYSASGGTADRTSWQGLWTPKEHILNQQVRDGAWLAIANKTTSDRPAPQLTGEPQFISGLGDNPSWVTDTENASQVLSGFRVTIGNPGVPPAVVRGFRVWIPVVDPAVTYSAWLVRDPTGTPIFDILLPSFEANEAGWLDVPIQGDVVADGTIFDLILATRNEATPNQFSYPWDYKTKSGDPDEKEAWHQDGGSELRINHVDNNDVDRQTDLETVAAGDTIQIAGTTYTVLGVDQQLDHVRFQVEPATRVAENTYTFTFTVFQTAPVTYVRIDNHYQSVAGVSGLFGTTDHASLAVNDNAYGVDVLLQDAAISADWDIQASLDIVGFGGGGAGVSGGSGSYNEDPATATGNFLADFEIITA